ncbi:MAG: M3 family oligoendopeptidase [archaeon]
MVVWKLEDIYPFEKTNELVAEVQTLTEKFTQYREQLPTLSPDQFMAVLQEKETLLEKLTWLEGYAGLWLTENTSDAVRLAHSSTIEDISADISNKLLFFNLWFKELPDDKVQEYIAISGKYHYVLETARRFRKYTLSEKEETILNLKGITSNNFSKLYDLITNRFRFRWEGKLEPQEKITSHWTSPSRALRKRSYQLVMKEYAQEEDVLGELYKSIVTDEKNEQLKIRKYDSPLSARNLDNDLPDAAVQALLNVVRKNRTVFQDYFKIKAKLCGIKKMDRYDLYAPFSTEERTYDFEQSKRLVLDTFKAFDADIYAAAQRIFDEQHVHADFTENKQSGAFCWTVTQNITPYVLLNHTGKLRDVTTMAHELGHGVHSLFAKDQTLYTFHSCLPLAETASIFAEMLLSKELMKTATKEEKISLLMGRLNDQYASITRQAYFTLFEQQAHDMIAKGCTLHDLNHVYLETLREQFGDALSVPDLFQHEWKYVSHIYHTPFYCYAYAFGNLLVLSLYNMYEQEGKSFIPKYKKLLSYGGSASPQKMLGELGIDITQEAFWQRGFDLIKESVVSLEREVNS